MDRFVRCSTGFAMQMILLFVALLADEARKPLDAIPVLIRQLGDDRYRVRHAAGRTLEAIGEAALPALRKSVGSPDPEVSYRSRRVIRAIMIAAGNSRSTGMSLSLLAAGKFQMGSLPAESGRRPDETSHSVTISKPFLLGTYEVTQDEYRKVMKADPSWFSSTGGGKTKVAGQKTDRYPVDNVSWFDAVEFCNRLSARDGYAPYYRITEVKRDKGSITAATVAIIGGSGYRLPTEAEWEYACRAGTTTPYYFGGGSNGRLANVKGVSYTGYGGRVVGPDLQRTTTVGSYKPNGFGLHDMHGNVAEWCWDWYARDYAAEPSRDPQGPATGHHRVLRGGSWLVTEASTRSASRMFHTPGERKYYSGFRVARTP